MGTVLTKWRRKKLRDKFESRFEASRSARETRLRSILGLQSRDVEIHLVPAAQELPPGMSLETKARLEKLGWKGQLQVEQSNAESKERVVGGQGTSSQDAERNTQFFFVEDEWDDDEEEEEPKGDDSGLPPKRDLNGYDEDEDEEEDSDRAFSDESEEGASSDDELGEETPAIQNPQQDPAQGLLNDPEIRKAFFGQQDAKIPFEVLQKVARAIQGEPASTQKQTIPENNTKRGQEGYDEDVQQYAPSDELDRPYASSSPVSEYNSSSPASEAKQETSPSAIKTIPPSPVVGPMGHPFSINELSFLPEFSKRKNRKALLRGHVVELFVVSLPDIISAIRFTTEYEKNLPDIEHPQIVRIHGVSKRKDTLYVVATDFKETSLREALNAGYKAPYPFILRFAFQICGALSYLHNRGLLHFNVYPETLFFDGNQPPNLFLLDTGVGRARFGPPVPYSVVPPEKMTKRKGFKDSDFSPAVDVFNFGFVLWELLTGLNPEILLGKKGMEEETQIASWSAANQRPPVLAVPPEFRQLIASCWAQDPRARPSVEDLLAELKRLILALRERQPTWAAVPTRLEPGIDDVDASSGASFGFPAGDFSPSAMRSRVLTRRRNQTAFRTLCALYALSNSTSHSDVDQDDSLTWFRKDCAIDLSRPGLCTTQYLGKQTDGLSVEEEQQIASHRRTFAGRPGLSGLSRIHGGETAVFEYHSGVALSQLILLGGCKDEGVLAHVAWGIIQGLGWLHRFHVAHGTVLPSNVICCRNGQVKLRGVEFLNPVLPTRPFHRWTLYKDEYAYFAPEVVQSNIAGTRSDIFSLGMCLLALALGQPYVQNMADEGLIRQHYGSWEFSPDKLEGDFSPLFKDFVAQCLKVDPPLRAGTEYLLRHPFLSSYIDYSGNLRNGSDPDWSTVDDDGQRFQEADSPSVALHVVEERIVRSELDLMATAVAQRSGSIQPHLVNTLLEGIEADMQTTLRGDFVKVHLKDLVSKLRQAAATTPLKEEWRVKQEAGEFVNMRSQVDQDVLVQEIRLDARGYLQTRSGSVKSALVLTPRERVAWTSTLAKIFAACDMYGVRVCCSGERDAIESALLESGVARVVVLDSQPSEFSFLLDIGESLCAPQDIALFAAIPDASSENVTEQLLARMTLCIVARHLGELRLLDSPFSPNLLFAIELAASRRNDLSKENHKYDVFIGSTLLGDASEDQFSQILLSWLASKPEEMMLAYVRRTEKVLAQPGMQSPSHGQRGDNAGANLDDHLERMISLEFASRVLFYFVGMDSLGYSLLMRAAMHVRLGKQVVLVLGTKGLEGCTSTKVSETERIKALFFRSLESYKDQALFVFDEEHLDEAIEKAVELSSTLDLLTPLEGLDGLENESSALAEEADAEEALVEHQENSLMELVDFFHDASLLGAMECLSSMAQPHWSLPTELAEDLTTKRELAKELSVAIQGRGGVTQEEEGTESNLFRRTLERFRLSQQSLFRKLANTVS